VDEIGVLGCVAQRSSHRSEDYGREPGPAAKSRHDTGLAGETAVALRPDDSRLDPAALELLDEVGDEAPGEVALAARIRRREDGDLQLGEDPTSLEHGPVDESHGGDEADEDHHEARGG
jgi:hypothetical protein